MDASLLLDLFPLFRCSIPNLESPSHPRRPEFDYSGPSAVQMTLFEPERTLNAEVVHFAGNRMELLIDEAIAHDAATIVIYRSVHLYGDAHYCIRDHGRYRVGLHLSQALATQPDELTGTVALHQLAACIDRLTPRGAEEALA